MLNSVLRIFRKKYQVLNRIEISRSRLTNNYQTLASLNSGFKIAPVLKSNAYGHGIKEIAGILDKNDFSIPFFCVDSLYEAYQIYKPILPVFAQEVKVKTPILVMGYSNPENLKWRKLPFQFAVWDMDFVKALDKYQKNTKVHIFVDTGMHREGVDMEELDEFLNQIREYPNIEVIGLMSHLASCNSKKDQLFLNQIANFKIAKKLVQKHNLNPKWFHLSASDPLMFPKTQTLIKQVSNLARVGKALYGISSKPHPQIPIQPVMLLKSQIIQIKQIKEGEQIGYGGSFQAPKNMTVGVLPIGYNDGVDRRLSNLGAVLIDKIACPIIGRVSMNITSVDISEVKNPLKGQEAIIYSNNPTDPNSIKNVALTCQTIAHEILVKEAPSTRRIIVD